ncbi:THUMP-like domain-containing protein [Gemmata sp.]|uniref:class I SAM-dependent methyltransferase n=1 Tax=Gemmata sp. TaxID=1914242 RepID=UPI003F6F53EE
MDLTTFRELLTPAGQRVLLAAAALGPTEAAFLACFEKLRKHSPPPLAKAALDTVLLRLRARPKFAAADRMYFTREALEQATGDAVATYRAARYASFGVVADLCCGIGGDALAFAAAGLTVHAVELDPLRAAMAAANAAALGVADRVTVHEADALTVPLPGVRAAFADPNRRSDGRRHLAPDDYTPPLSALRGRFEPGFPLGVKAAPGVARDDVAALGAEAEFISVGGEMKECVLWFGPLRSAAWRATVLPAGVTLAAADEPTPTGAPAEVGAYAYDPDPAVVRAGLTGVLAEQLGLSPFDWSVATLTGPELVRSPFVTAYRVEHSDRFHAGRLRDYLRERGVGRVTMVKRGSMLDADEVARKLKLSGSEHRVVLLTRIGGEQGVIVGERLAEVR